jgi:hypothetical protein
MPAPLNQLPWDVAKDGSSGINWSPSPLRSLGPGCSRRAVGAGLRQQALVGGLVKTYRKEELAANNRSASGAGVAAGAPQFAHVRTLRGGWKYRTTAVLAPAAAVG